jgi:hypothetical protein
MFDERGQGVKVGCYLKNEVIGCARDDLVCEN